MLKPFLRRRSSIQFMSDYSSEFQTSSQLLFGQVSAANSAQPIISMAWNLFTIVRIRAYHFNKSFSMSTFISPLRPHSILIYFNRSFAMPTFICTEHYEPNNADLKDKLRLYVWKSCRIPFNSFNPKQPSFPRDPRTLHALAAGMRRRAA